MKPYKPIESYITRRTIELVHLRTKIDINLKKEAQEWAEKLETSLNRFVEASIKYYIDSWKEQKK